MGGGAQQESEEGPSGVLWSGSLSVSCSLEERGKPAGGSRSHLRTTGQLVERGVPFGSYCFVFFFLHFSLY